MSSSSNYNAITNLTETIIDYLIVDTAEIDTAIVDNLDCNVGTIDTLTSTTATITSANIPTLTNTTLTNTTSNTTNLKTNNLQPITNASSVNVFTNADSTINIGKYGNTNLITLNQSTLLQTNSNLTLNGTGIIITPNLRVSSLTANKIVLSNVNNDLVSSSYTDTDLAILSANNTFTGNNIFSGTNTFNNTIFGNTIRGTSAGSTISLFSNTTAGITLGGTSSGISLADNTTLPANKTITLNATGGKILCNVYTGNTSSSNLTLGESGNTGNLDIFKTITSSNTYSGINTFSGGNTHSGNNIFSGTNTFNNTILGNTITGTSVGSAISLYGTTTSTIGLGNLSGGTFTINPNTQMNGNLTLATGKNLTLQPTGELIVETIRGYAFANTINMYLAQLGAINFGNTSSTNPLTINNNTILASGKTLTLNATGGKVLCNVYTGTTTSSNLTLGESGDTGNLEIFKTITSSNTYSGNNTYSGSNTFSGSTNTFNNTILVNTLTGTTTGSAISLFGTSTSTIDLGNTSSTSLIRLNQNTSVGVGKVLRTPYLYPISTLADLYVGNQGTDSGILYIELNTDLHSSRKLKLNNTTASKLLLTNASKEIISSAYTDSDFVLKSGSSMSGTLSVNNIEGTTTSSSITLFTNSSVSSPTITLGNASGGTFTINPNTQLNGNLTLASSKNLTLSSTGNLICNTLQGTAITSAVSLYANIVGGTIALGTSLTGSMNIGTSMRNGILTIGSASFNIGTDTGNVVINMPVYFNQDLNIATGKDIVMASTGLIKCETYTGLAYNLAFNLGENGDSAGITCNRTMTFDINKNLTMNSTGIISVNTINATSSSSTGALFGNIVAGTCNIATSLTGNFNIATSVRNGFGSIGSSSFNSATDTGLLDIYLPTRIFQDITLSTTNKILGNSYQGRTSASNVSLFTDTISGATISIGNTAGGNCTINPNVVLASGKNLTLSTTGKIVVDTIEGTAPADNIVLFSTTTGTCAFGNTSGGNLTINPNVVLATGKSITGSSTSTINCPAYRGLSATSSFGIGDNTTTGNIVIGSSLTSGTVNISGATTGNVILGSALTSGNVSISNTSATGRVICNNKAEFTTATNSCYINTSTGVNLFTSTYLAGKPLSSNIYAGAPTDQWNVWDSNCENSLQDGSAICQNGNTTIIVNPGDQSCLWWIDEDIMTTATNYAITTGWKISTTGAITNLSDRRVKRNIKPVIDDHILDKLLELELVKFQYKPPTPEKEYKNGKLRTKYTEYHSGYVAQNVKKVFPDACERVNDDAYWMLKKDVVNDYYNLGVQELIKRDKEKQAQIDAQKLQIDDLTARLVRLEQILLNP